MGKVERCSYIIRDEDTDEHCHEITVTKYLINKPVVFCFSGNGTTKQRNANFICHVAQNLVGAKKPVATNDIASSKCVDFIGVCYGNDYHDEIDGTGSLTTDEVSNFCKTFFTSLYLDENSKVRSKEEILKNFNLITFFAYCHGAREVSSIYSQVCNDMRQVGINKQTIQAAMKQVFAVSYAPIIHIPFPCLQVIPEKDDTIFYGPKLSYISGKFLMDRQETKAKSKGTIAYKEDEDTISLIVADMTKHTRDEHSLSMTKRDDRWNYLEKRNNLYGDAVSMAMGVALSDSIASGIRGIQKPTIDESLRRIKSILGTTQSEEFANTINQIRNGFER